MAVSFNKQIGSHAGAAVDVCKACIERINELKMLNAFITIMDKSALKQADESDQRYRTVYYVGQLTSKLDGLPIAVKDNFCVAGDKTTCASKMLQNFIPPYDATVVSRLKKAGAVIIGKTNLDEFAMGSGTVDSIYGPTKNIWGSSFHTRFTDVDKVANDTCRIAGGSSGGSAVAVAAGMCFAALGSDTGGSTRNPASYCGVVGFKPSYGAVSRFGLIPLVNSMDVPGIIAQKVDHVEQVFDIISGVDDKDSTTIQKDFSTVNEELDIKNISIGIPDEYDINEMCAEVKTTWRNVADMLSNSGASVKRVSLPHTQASIATYSILNQCEVASNMARYSGLLYGHRSSATISTEHLIAESRKQGFGSVIKSRILSGNYFLLQRNYEKYFVKAMKVRRLITDDFAKVWLSGIDFLLTPTTLTTAPLLSDFIQLDNRQQCSTQDYCTQPSNMAGCPAISLPVRLSEDGLPISLQIMANNFHDKRLLTFSKWLESTFSFPRITQRLPWTVESR